MTKSLHVTIPDWMIEDSEGDPDDGTTMQYVWPTQGDFVNKVESAFNGLYDLI
jgi:gentisate 1,2-dioxygenase